MAEIHSSESGLNTCNHRFKISISPQVRLAGCSSWCCVFSVPWSLVMFLCYAPSVMLFWILSSSSFLWPWITLPVFCRETNAAGGLHCHPKTKLWMQPLLWKWIKEVYFGSKKLSEKSRSKTMRPDRELVSFRLSIHNIVYYSRPNSLEFDYASSSINYKQMRSKNKKMV
jgi:hypothetical protein